MTWMTHRPNREAHAISNYWDKLVRQKPALPVPPPDLPAGQGTLLRQLHAEEELASTPAYRDELLDRLLATYGETTSMTTTTAAALPQPRSGPQRPTFPRAQIRRQAIPALEIALIVALILASVATIWLANNDGRRIVAPSVATPTEASLDVPMYRGNPERTGVMPGPGIDGEPVQLWRLDVPGPIYSAPALVDGILYFGARDGGVYAVDSATGVEVWQYQAAGQISSSPAVIDGGVYIGSADGILYALNAADGSELWTLSGTQPNVSPVVVGNALYTGSDDGFLLALDTATGEEFWRAPLNAPADRSLAVADGAVYQGSTDGVLHTFDATTGDPGWALKLEGLNLVTAAIANGVVYQSTFLGDINHAYALDAATGEQLWRFDTESGQGFLPPAIGETLVYLPSTDFSVYAVDAATGALVWHFETSDQIIAAPALVGDTLYVVSNDGFVYALDAATGVEQWRFAVEGESDFGPVVSGGVAYVGTGFGYLYAIGGSGEEIPASPGASPVVMPATPMATPGVTPVGQVASPEATASIAEFVWQVGEGDPLPDQPEGLAVAPDGTVWIVDSRSRQLHQFTSDGTYVASWDGAALGVENFLPRSFDGSTYGTMAFDQAGNAYVLDSGNFRVLVFSPEMELLREWGSQGQDQGQFMTATDLAIDSAGNVYVMDVTGRQKLQKFSPDGEFLATIGGPDEEEGRLSAPAAIGIGPDDILYVPDDSHVVVFAPDGTFLRTFGEGTLGYAVDAVVDAGGNVHVSDAEQNQVQVYDRDGTLIGSWGSFGREPGQMIEPTMLARDEQGHIYVIDYANGRVQKFALTLPAPAADATPVATPAAP